MTRTARGAVKTTRLLFFVGAVALTVWVWVINLSAVGVSNGNIAGYSVKSYLSRPYWRSTNGHKLGHNPPTNTTSTEIDDKTGKSSSTANAADQQRQARNTDNDNLHIVFSTGCSAFQDWQSYVFFYHANKVGQKGHVTRVASGCDSEDTKIALQEAHVLDIQQTFSTDKFHLHITPDYAKMIPGKNYKFFNKPFGLRHWMEHELGFSPDETTNNTNDDTIFIILDPDQMIVRPFTADFDGQGALMPWQTATPPDPPIQVQHGRPFGQYYLLMGQWIETVYRGRHKILASLHNESAAAISGLHDPKLWSSDVVLQHYSAGPPYMATGRDMYQIMSTWATFAVPVYELTDNHLSEMFAYAVASGHLNLPHQLGHSFMVSNIQVDAEGWAWPDHFDNGSTSTSSEPVCGVRNDYVASAQRAAETQDIYMPNVLHFCQRYFLGPFFFSKYILPKNFLNCQQPLMVEPPADLADKFSSSVTPNGVLNEIPSQNKRNRMAFVLCLVIAGVNDAADFWKRSHCDETTANFNKTFVFELHEKSMGEDSKREVKVWN